MNEFELRSQLRGLRVDREPDRDLWPGIESRVPPRRARSLWPWALAASLAVAAVGLAVMRPLLQPEAPAVAQAEARARPMAREAEAMALNYRAALAELAGRPLPAELRPVARELDDSVREIRLALEEAPDSRLLLEQLRRTYDRRLRLGQRGQLS